jgi:phospholipase A1
LSIFDINGRSAPFRATNYNPEAVFVWDDPSGIVGTIKYKVLRLRELRFSLYDHNSSGVDSASSRRWERMYVQPEIELGRMITTRVKIWWETPYKDGLSSKNENIEDYLGKGMLTLNVEPHQRFNTEVNLTRGSEFGTNYGIDVSWRPFELDFFLYLQYYDGYGEELIDYNIETKSLRGGLRFN